MKQQERRQQTVRIVQLLPRIRAKTAISRLMRERTRVRLYIYSLKGVRDNVPKYDLYVSVISNVSFLLRNKYDR